MRVTVAEAQPQAEQAQAQARCEGPRAEVWVLADRLRGSAVQSKRIDLDGAHGWAYRFGDGVLLVLQVSTGAGQQPWTPTWATLRAMTDPKEEVKVRAVHVREGPRAPGEWSPVAVEADLPSPAAGTSFTLKLRDAGGRSLAIDVEIPPAPVEKGGGR
jgi:hypothetical protein